VRVVCVGGGPAGLYLAILLKHRDRHHDVIVIERNPPGLTYGWGVVFWNDLLRDLQDSDPPTARDIRENCFGWEGQVVHVQGRESVHLGGHGYSMGRQRLLGIFTKRAIDLGVRIQFEREVEDLSQLPAADLIVACDGVNSRLRRLHADQFETSLQAGRNKYIWLGTTKVFDAFTFAFVETVAGWIWFHAYGYGGDASTCIVECSPETWRGLGFDTLGLDESIALLERTFDRYLDGHPLIGQGGDLARTPWLSFREVTNGRWHHHNLVLMGDAAHTTHFTIGSGTRLALQDAIGLAARLHEHNDVGTALEAYEKQRKAALLLPQRQARNSARWFESIPRYIGLGSPHFATLLGQRRSRLLAHLPPGAYCRLHQAARKVAVLRRLRRRARPRA
jgi:2-polyprenyl-6-methoxyphenol hydroxylase-like FAD-dependent oxidoreductase